MIANPNEHIAEKTRTIQEDPVKVLKRDNGETKNITLIDKTNIHYNRLQVISLALIAVRALPDWLIFCNYRIFRCLRYNIKVRHNLAPLLLYFFKR